MLTRFFARKTWANRHMLNDQDATIPTKQGYKLNRTYIFYW
jgi:hypothetical protein